LSYFITLEGPEGSGKTSHTEALAKHLVSLGWNVLHTREPGGTSIGDQIRDVLGSLENTAMRPSTEFLLFSASRAQHVEEVIRPHLETGGVVVCDRYFDSSLAYQGYGHGLDLEALRQITRFATGGLIPDLTLLLDIPVEDGLKRRQEGGSWNRLDAYALEFHRRVREGYLALAAAESERWVKINALPAWEAVQDEIRSVAESKLAQEGGNG
jgi:dTMP kinase